MNLEAEKKLTIEIAHQAGDVMREYWNIDQQVQRKSDGSPVTIADKTINRLVIERLTEIYPDDVVIGEEESTGDYGMGRRWICDPIDGTKAYTWRVPTAMFSLALVIDGVPVLGVCYEPITDLMYVGLKNEGAFCNGRRLQVNQQDFASGILGTISSQYRIRKQARYFDALLEKRVDMAAFSGAVAKCVRVADGTFVGYLEELLDPHDVAASYVIVTEAGGKMTAPDGSVLDFSIGFKGAVVSNSLVHDELIDMINN